MAVTSCAIVSLVVAYLLPVVYEEMRLSPWSSPPPEPGYSALADIKGTPYYDRHASRFAGSNSHAETQAIKQKIDQMESDCRTLVGAWPEWTIWQRCRSAAQWSTFIAGALQFAIGAMAILLRQRRRRAQ